MARVILTSFVTVAACLAVSLSSAQAGSSSVQVLQPAVLKILEASCAKCHDGTTRRRDKGDFDHVLDIQKMIEGDFYLVPGDPEFSEIYLTMIEEDPDLRMPPPDNTEVYQPTEADIKLVRDWIVALAEEPVETGSVEEVGSTTAASDKEDSAEEAAVDNVTVVVAPVSALDSEEVPPAFTEETEDTLPVSPPEIQLPEKSGIAPITLFARFHPLVVHFPVAAVPMAGLIGLFGLITGRYQKWLPAVRWALVFAAVLAPLSVATGWLLSDIEGYSDATVFLHRWSAVVLTVFTWVALITVQLAERRDTAAWRRGAVAFLLASVLLAGFVGHTGGELVYGIGYPFITD